MRIDIDQPNYNSLIQIVEKSTLPINEKTIVKELASKILSESPGGVGVSGRLSYYLQKIGDSRIQFVSGPNHQCKIVIDQNKPSITQLGDVNSRDQYGKTKLANAIMRGDMKEFMELILSDEIDLELADRDGWTTIYRTFVANQPEMFNILLDLTSLNTKNNVGSRLIHIAVDRNNIDALAKLLAKGAKVNVTNVRGSPLLYAVEKGNERSVNLLLKHNADPNLISDSLIPSPLWVAKTMRNDKLAETLTAHGAVQFPERAESSELEKLVKTGKLEDIYAFIQSKPDMVDQHGRTPLIYASWYGRKDVVQLLLKGELDINHKDNDQQKTALHYAVIAGHKDIVEALLKAKADVNAMDKAKYSPLHWCAQYYGRLEIAKLLVESGADIHAKEAGNWEPFHKCAETGNLEVMKWLVEEKHVDVNTLHGNGLSALHRAVINNRADVEAYLKEKGIDVSIKDSTGKTAEDYRVK